MSTITSTALNSLASAASAASASAASASSVAAASSAAASANNGASNSNNTGNSGPSSPLLFFVALGFGVVFTNLWIIVGVKYCFRYNQRNRARMNGDDPDAVDLAAMPRQRRRREKKLMSMEEVNEKFPLTKYKTWRSTRAEEGLPTAGGINAAASRPASIKNVARISEEEEESEPARSSSPEIIHEKGDASEPSSPTMVKSAASVKTTERSTDPSVSASSDEQRIRKDDEDEEDVDQIQTAIPAEQLPDPGDTCAICIDVLEDDDDIRGLTCGHAFHASCVDPWLTSRRACCPLCKADYYVPRPRPEGADGEDQSRRRPQREDFPPRGFSILTGTGRRRGNPTMMPILGGRFGGGRFMTGATPSQVQRERNASINRRAREQNEAVVGVGTDTNQTENTEQQESWWSRMNLPRRPTISMVRTGRGGPSQTGVEPSTPGQLEAGTTVR